MKKITFFLAAGAFLFVGYKNLPDTLSNGAPAASTGAPLEKHCAASGCHSDFQLNSGSAQVFFSVGNGETQYEPGKTYPVTVSVSEPGIVRFGFQVVVLNNNNTNAGTIQITEPVRTQIVPGFGNISDRKYVTYTFDGTSAVSAGLGKWTFDWTAPENNEGNVTFYLACISADNDGTDMGDYCFTRTLALNAPPVVADGWNIYPSASSSIFNVQCFGTAIECLKIFSTDGKKVYEKNNIEPGTSNCELNNPCGVYFVSVTQNGKTETGKIVIVR